MRGKKAKRLRRLHPERPNPGRKHGGEMKEKRRQRELEAVHSDAATPNG